MLVLKLMTLCGCIDQGNSLCLFRSWYMKICLVYYVLILIIISYL